MSKIIVGECNFEVNFKTLFTKYGLMINFQNHN